MAKEDPLFSPESVRLVYVFSTRTRQSPSRLSEFSIRLDSNYPLPTDDRGDCEGFVGPRFPFAFRVYSYGTTCTSDLPRHMPMEDFAISGQP